MSLLLGFIRRKVWMLIVVFMVGIHNFYKQEDKSPDNIVITIEEEKVVEVGSPKK